MFSRVSFLSVFATFVALSASQQCFGLDGSKLDDTFAPCNPTAKHSGCCATNRPSGAELCLDTGLCMSTTGQSTGMIWQAGCTDETGKAVECPRVCPGVSNNFGGLTAIKAWNIQQCDSGTYCCRAPNDKRSCCDSSSAPKVTISSLGSLQLPVATATPVPSSTSSPSSSPKNVAATAVSTGSTFLATSAASPDTCTKERHQTAVVGGTIGGLFGTIIVALACLAFWLHKSEARQRRLKNHYEEQFVQTAAYRRTLASTISLLGSNELEEVKSRPTTSP
ncbi:hypothetical protein HBI56_061750 [Parastagonospora nodorum]|nr:hypothetical protein HBH53_125070 [Parastagonospora nodorum]KAH3973497.1 hypothetical protein HBH51_098290 [Parastagonospora nodorum]KAH4002457.1 hypothetical protein HBI10_074610 [Parastagonospora nodorum]KAH4017895.1 hypothetical protein HBI13_136520 [Parastagonospora nodorum]KAH4036134.1 hypothetical protein HBI09_083140 [Parastagonospora nodorum]